ncbi:polyprenyl synthetase family protein [Microbacterium saccharophilum]|uniref:Polyprenyl synthetase family protein n=1 Tax=Microbacterium saccharophilum TaxID=1213358 RepID=A0A5C8I8D9_9MICO|nr:polyprenyl synthetase family protein [Microbacterium saccharophilum]TXK14153.1 polyprenyl synthetase family protein [Microbacterium saccharophilum]GEP46706.1 geranylgeranyl pyrophosphate synthase [Microbacterium saccharophilum]
MITVSPAAREAVDVEIDASLSRLQARTARRGPSARALADATARAAAGGKRLRPALVVASFEAFGGSAAETRGVSQVAAAFELLHTAFVVHDDLIDRDTQRRGAPNVGGEFRARAGDAGATADGAALLGDAAAVLSGDLLLFEATRMVATAALPDATRAALLELLDDAILVSAIGELADVEHAVLPDYPDTPALLNAAHDKTAAYSFRAPLAAGALMADATAAERTAVETIGGLLGLAFQLVDDLIGTFGTAEQAGREPGADLREAKRTPLIALAQHSPAWPRVSSALAVAHTGPIALRAAQRELDASGAREELITLVRETLAQAQRLGAETSLGAPVVSLLAQLATAIDERIP